MLKYKVKNLINAALEGEVNVIAHQCNCYCAMGAGIAPQIANNFLEAEDADNNTVPGDSEKLGTCTMAESKGVIIFNLYGQYGASTGEVDTDYEALESALVDMSVGLLPFDEIGMPKIGCGLAGGDWGIVSGIIEDVLDEFNVTIYVLNESEIPQGSKVIDNE